MKTFADVKRRAVMGARLTMTFHAFGAPKLVGVPREITRVQGNAIAFRTHHADGPRDSWLYWPKASALRVTGPDTFDVIFEEDTAVASRGEQVGAPFMSYRFE